MIGIYLWKYESPTNPIHRIVNVSNVPSITITHNESVTLWFIFFIVIRYSWLWHVEPFAQSIHRSESTLQQPTVYLDQSSICIFSLRKWVRGGICIDLLSRLLRLCSVIYPKYVPLIWVARIRRRSMLSNWFFFPLAITSIFNARIRAYVCTVREIVLFSTFFVATKTFVYQLNINNIRNFHSQHNSKRIAWMESWMMNF